MSGMTDEKAADILERLAEKGYELTPEGFRDTVDASKHAAARLRGEAQAEQQAVGEVWEVEDDGFDVAYRGTQRVKVGDLLYTRPQPAAVAGDAAKRARAAYESVRVYHAPSAAELYANEDAAWQAVVAALSSTAAPDTDRRRPCDLRAAEAVSILLGQGWTLRDEKWEQPTAALAPVAGDAVAVVLADFNRNMALCDRSPKLDRERVIGRLAIAHMDTLRAALAQDRASPECHASPTGKHESAPDEPALSERWCQWCSAEFSAAAQDRASQSAPVTVPDLTGYTIFPTSNLRHIADKLDADGDEHGVAADIRKMIELSPGLLAAAHTPAAEREVGNEG